MTTGPISVWATELSTKTIKLYPWISPLNPTNYVRNVCLRTLWGLVKNAHMTIKPTLITEQFSSAILYSAHTASSTLLWVQPAGKGSTLTTTEEPGRPPGRLLPPHPAPAAPATVALLWTSDLSSGSWRMLCKLSLSLPLHRQGNSGATIDV